ncbi:MAG: Ldh family oxidoreductase [bacterium]|nr:Ldh family oxidoreductase [bacterium]
MKIAIDELRDKILTTLKARYSDAESAQIADILLYAESSGIKPMGIVKMVGTEPIQDMVAEHEPKIERETKLSQLINAGGNAAPVVCHQAVETAIKKAKEHGMAIVGVNNTHSSNLTQAYYVEKIAKNDLIGISMASAPASSTGFDSIDPIFGTNPIGFSFPTNDKPLVFDMTTAAMAWSGLVLASAHGEKIPENIAIDSRGNPTLDPNEAMEGATLPFDHGYKGSGLGLIVETLAGPLVNAAYVDTSLDSPYGSLFIAIDPNILVDIEEFKKHASDLLSKVKATRKKPGASEIRLPGERAQGAREQALASGEIDVDEAILKQLGYI